MSQPSTVSLCQTTSLLFVCSTTVHFPGISSTMPKQYHILVEAGRGFLCLLSPCFVSNLIGMTYWILSGAIISCISLTNALSLSCTHTNNYIWMCTHDPPLTAIQCCDLRFCKQSKLMILFPQMAAD